MARKATTKSTKTSSVAPAAESKTSAPAAPPPLKASEQQIRMLAYLKWEAAGKPPGDGSYFWHQAEQELKK